MLYSRHTELEEGREKAMSDKNRKPVIPQVIKAFMVVLPLTVDKITHNGVLLGYHPDTGGENTPVRHKCKEWLLAVVK